MPNRPLRVAILCDMLEERWESMDLIGRVLTDEVSKLSGIEATRVCPPMRRRFSNEQSTPGVGFTADRLLNRMWDYPRYVSTLQDQYDVFHVIDHSYSQLVHKLPASRTIVTCHDIDTFRSVVTPLEQRSIPFRAMTRHILSGLKCAAHVACASETTRDQLLQYDLLPQEKLHVVLNGLDAAFSANPDHAADNAAAKLLGTEQHLDILHVGTTIPRKRIDVLLRTFAGVVASYPEARLVRVGGDLTQEQMELAKQLGISEQVVTLPRLELSTLAAVYRRAALTLIPSEREGFGLPLAESLGCGTPVLASDIPALREVGSTAAQYAPVGEVNTWVEEVNALLHQKNSQPVAWLERRTQGIARAANFSWKNYAEQMAALYLQTAKEDIQ